MPKTPVSEVIKKAKSLLEKGELEEAKKLYESILKTFPDNEIVQRDLAALNQVQPVAEAQGAPEKAIRQLSLLYNEGQLNTLLKLATTIIEKDQNAFDVWNIIGAAHKRLKHFEVALHAFKKATEINPYYAHGFNNIGSTLKDQGNLDEAIEAYKQAILIKPDFAEAHNNMAITLKDQGKREEAMAACKKALLYKPDYAEAYYFLGNLLNEQQNLDEAIEAYNKALSLKPNYPNLYNNMGNVFSSQGRLDEAIIAYKKALSFQPDHAVARTQKLHEQANICDWTAIIEEHDYLENLGLVGQAVMPFALLSLEDAPERHQLRSQKYAKTKFSQPAIAFPNPTLKKPTRLRIGYFSSDFNDHPVTHLITKMLSLHDREAFEVFAYSFGGMHSDHWRGKVIGAVDNFKDVTEMNDREIALLARQDNLNIAIDLNGYTKNSRPGIFAYRAAPIQISYLGIAMTMGTDFIDYLIADRISIPIETSSLYNEKIIYLPDCYQVNNNSINIESVSVNRSQMSLPDEGFVFCCFNQSFKITPSVFDIWMRVLRQIEGSVLWLYKSNEWAAQNLQKEATRRGVCNQRLIFAERLPLEQHIARHKLADLFLDTFNFNAGATGSTALWAGVPLITKLGKGFTARVSASLLDAIGLPELITQTELEYENLILDLAKNPARLDTIKEKLKSNKFHTPLFDTEVFTKHIEEGYSLAFERFWDGKAPQSMYVGKS